MPQVTSSTPMMKQYLEIKAQYPDAFLFYRIGDFYELFYEDAEKAAQILELTLTCRNKNAQDPIPMCGVPHHSAQGYIDTLIAEGYKVAICEQVEDAKMTKPNQMVKREVIQLITPGTNVELGTTDAKNNNYLVALLEKTAKQYVLCYVDLSTGELKVTTIPKEMVLNECASLQTKEIVCLTNLQTEIQEQLTKSLGVIFSEQSLTDLQINNEITQKITDETEKQAVNGLYTYLVTTQKRYLEHLQDAEHYEVANFLKMDYDSKYNLELVSSIRTGKKHGTLLWLLDETKTAMGGRLLKQWIERPLINVELIKERQRQVQSLMDAFFERQQLQENLKQVYDLERLVGKVSFGTANARDLLQLKTSLEQIPQILLVIEGINQSEWTNLLHQIDPLENLVDLIERAILEEASLSIKDGNVIKPGYNQELDKYLDAMHNGKKWLANLEAKERQATGISKMKIGFNRVFGYYLEVSKAMSANVPDYYDRKQTLTNSERFTTPELKEMERTILEAEEKSKELEYQLFVEIREQIKANTKKLQALAKAVAKLDVLQSFATISENYQYVMPEFNNEGLLELKEGRHPVVEKVIGEQQYVANDLYMDQNTNLLLITGPNMSGKSTYMRQLALIVIMAQMGCFVPCDSAKMPIFDQIFTRIGASDNLISGQSTFMVEMMEANNALTKATPNSLILFDELGRGTSTYDGMALAQSIIEHIHNHVHAKTLFSTHYHELTALEDMLAHLQNIHVEAVEQDGEIIFMHKIQPGPADKSYGVHVAKIAGLPPELLIRAEELLQQFESQSIQINEQQSIDESDKNNTNVTQVMTVQEPEEQLSLFALDEHQDVIQELEKLNLLQMTPMEAFNKLYELQQKL